MRSDQFERIVMTSDQFERILSSTVPYPGLPARRNCRENTVDTKAATTPPRISLGGVMYPLFQHKTRI